MDQKNRAGIYELEIVREEGEVNCARARVYVPFLAGGVPYLSFDEFIGDFDVSVSEFNSDGGLGIQTEFIVSEPGQKI